MEDGDVRKAARNNAIRSVLLVAGFPLVLPAVVFVLLLCALLVFGRHDAFAVASTAFFDVLIAMVVFTVGWLPIGYLLNQWIIDKATGARMLGRSEYPQLWRIFEGLCAKCGMRLPALRIIDTDMLNAYASGLSEGRYSVTVTRGLIDALNDEEMAGVLAHELTHIRNHDVRLLVVATVLVGTIPMLHDLVMKAFWAIVMGILNLYRAIFTLLPLPGAKLLVELSYTALFWVGKIVAYVIGFVGTVSSLIIHFALSREREFMADAGAVEITGMPHAMISALRKISGNSTLDTAIDGVRAMCFDSAAFGWGGLFATHPPIEKRIEAIARLAQAMSKPEPLRPPRVTAPEPPRPPALPGAITPQAAQHAMFFAPPRGVSTAAPPSAALPPIDPATVSRYRQLVLRARPEGLSIEGRKQLYSRLRQAVQNGQQSNPTLTVAQLAFAKVCLDEAIRQIETSIATGSLRAAGTGPNLGH